MKNKKIIIIVIIVLIILVVIISSIIHNNNLYNRYENMIKNKINNIYNDLSKYDYKSKGSIDLTAKYRGAHGESNPTNFKYNFEITNTSFTLESDGNYYTKSLGSEYKSSADESLNDILSKNSSDYERIITSYVDMKRSSSDILITLDTNYINSLFNTSFDSISLDIKLKGLLYKSVSSLVLNYKYTYDGKVVDNNLNISPDLKEIVGEINNLDFRYIENSRGYSISYNKLLKINKIKQDGYNEVNIVYDNYSFTLELYDDHINFMSSGDAAIYKGIDMNIYFIDNNINRVNELSDEEGKNIPIIRYLTNLGCAGSEC